ncbi:MAG: hypothetical protein ACJAS4_000706 [Bacteriovoracaceae bacterium]
MVLLQDAKDLFNQFHVGEALKHLCEKLDIANEKDDEFVQYILINQFTKNNQKDFNLKFCNYLYQQKYFSEIYEIINSKELKDLYSSEIIILLDSIFQMGRINEFFLKAKEINEYLLVNKYYVVYEKFVEVFNERLKSHDFFKLGKLLFLVEMNDIVKMNIFIKEQMPLLLAGKVEATFILAVYNLLEQVKTDDYKHHKNKILYKFFLKIKDLNEVLVKDFVDLLLLAEQKEDFFLTYEVSDNKVFKNSLMLYLKETYTLKLKEISPIFKLLKNDWDGKITISKINIANTAINTSIIKKEELIKSANLSETFFEEIYNLEEDEKRVLLQLQVEKNLDEISSDIIISYIKLRFFKVAEFLAKNLVENSNKYYLNSIIMLGQNNYPKVIELCNTALGKFKITEEEAVPFEYLKAEAFEYLDDFPSARICLERIAAINPNFRNTEEKLLK